MSNFIKNYKAMSKYQREVQGIHDGWVWVIEAFILAIVMGVYKFGGFEWIWGIWGLWIVYNFGYGAIQQAKWGKILLEEGEESFLMKFAGADPKQAKAIAGGWNKVKGE